jgi:glycosyltransferase involved in cell wall biosynthesis
MGSGLPVVASRVGGIPELIDDERTGLLVPPGDARTLAAALGRLMEQRELGAKLGSAAVEKVESQFSFERMTAAFEAIYFAELSRRGVSVADRLRLAAS